MNCPHCEELQHELDMLRREVRGELDVASIGRFCADFGLSGTQARLLAALYCANGRVMSRHALEEATSTKGGYESNTLSVMISKIRDRIGHGSIETINGLGYRLSEAGLALVSSAAVVHERVAA